MVYCGGPEISELIGTDAKVFFTHTRILRGIRLIMWPILYMVVGWLLFIDRPSISASFIYILLISAMVLLFSWELVVEAPGEIHIDRDGLRFHKWKRSVAIPWSNINWAELSTSKRWPATHVFLKESVPEHRGGFFFFWNMVDFQREDHIVISSGDWEPEDVAEIYMLIKHRMGYRDAV